MKEQEVLKFLAAGTHLGGTNLDSQMEQYICKGKSGGIRIWHSVQQYWRAVLKFAAATGATPPAGGFTPGTFTNQIQAAPRSRSRDSWWLRIPGLSTSLSGGANANLPAFALCDTTLLRALWSLPSLSTTRALTQRL
ncbi:40S ribosomal protein SA [Myotis davidii]|uniref:40S ribosomal protein SA n=1 Tax=Myotis davidii TaxID=225400 RepID=L5LDV7_MYODS|nr:40S ribosomal protein SA [Myotis davidii]